MPGMQDVLFPADTQRLRVLTALPNLQSTLKTSDNNTLHTDPRAARLLETLIFAAAR